MMNLGRFGRKLRVEALESRRMLAGNVTAQLLGTTLLIRGDNAANGVAIFAGATPGTLDVVGSAAGGSDTTINGIAAEGGFSTDTIRGRVTNIVIDARGGDDAISLVGLAGAPLSLPQNVTILGGAGDDTITVNDVVGKNLTVDTGNGGTLGDAVIIDASTFTSGVTLVTGNANDIVNVTNSNFNRDLVIVTNNGGDTVTIGESLAAATAAPVTIGGSLVVVTGAGFDTITVAATTVARDLVLNAGDGGSLIAVGGASGPVAVGGVATIVGGNGVDTISINGLTGRLVNNNTTANDLKQLTVVTGSGADIVTVAAAAAGGVGVQARDAVFDLGAGDDSLIFNDSIVSRRATFIGGPGTNTLTRTNNTIARQTVIQFQTII